MRKLWYQLSGAQQWVEQGFAPDDNWEGKSVGHWFYLGFTPAEARFWVDLFSPLSVIEVRKGEIPFLASYAREKGYYQNRILTEKYNPQDLEQEYSSWKEEATSQEWLDFVFPEKVRVKVKVLDLWWDFKLKGHLQLKRFTKLTELDLYSNQLTSLDLSDLNKEKLLVLDNTHSNITNFSFLPGLVNLEELCLRFNYSLTGSLEIFVKMERLRVLDIKYTKLDTDLEYLPVSLEEFCCSDTKIAEELKKNLQEGEKVEDKSIILLNCQRVDGSVLLNRWRIANLERVERIWRILPAHLWEEFYNHQVKEIFLLKEQFLQKRQQTITILENICNDLENTNLKESITSEELTNFLATSLKLATTFFPGIGSASDIRWYEIYSGKIKRKFRNFARTIKESKRRICGRKKNQ